MTFRFAFISIIIVIYVSLAGCAPTVTAHDNHATAVNTAHVNHITPNTTSNASITEQDIEYSPSVQVVHTGQSIRLTNKDPFDHKSRVTEQLKDGGLGHIALKDHVDKPGDSYTFSLDKPGTYEIRCLLHDGMTAKIKAVK